MLYSHPGIELSLHGSYFHMLDSLMRVKGDRSRIVGYFLRMLATTRRMPLPHSATCGTLEHMVCCWDRIGRQEDSDVV